MLLQYFQTNNIDLHDSTHLYGSSLVRIMPCIEEMIAKIVLQSISINFNIKLLLQSLFYC